MLTDTQREWAQAQFGKDRVAEVTGTIVTATPGQKGQSVLEVEGENGKVAFDVIASTATINKMRAEEMTVRVEGEVTGIVYDEEAGQVGLEITGEKGFTTEWITPEISDEERAALNLAQYQEEQEQIELEKDLRRESFKQDILALLREDSEVRMVVADLFPRPLIEEEVVEETSP